MLLSSIHCCDITKPRYLLSGELCTSPLHSNRLYVYTVRCRRSGQCFSVLRTRHTDVVGESSGRSYVTEQGHNVPLLRTRDLVYLLKSRFKKSQSKHSQTIFPSLHLRHSSSSKPSVALPTSQLILQPFFWFSYITGSLFMSPGDPPMD